MGGESVAALPPWPLISGGNELVSDGNEIVFGGNDLISVVNELISGGNELEVVERVSKWWE